MAASTWRKSSLHIRGEGSRHHVTLPFGLAVVRVHPLLGAADETAVAEAAHEHVLALRLWPPEDTTAAGHRAWQRRRPPGMSLRIRGT
jgi:hypothetical protein